MSQIAQQLANVQQRIIAAAEQARRNPSDIQLLAVSKSQPVNAILEAFHAGQRLFGESYVQEAIAKITTIEEDIGPGQIEWHFIGPIQSNKTAAIASHFAWVHSIDRLKIAHRLNEQRPTHLPPLNVCLQVNISGESSKSGLQPAQVFTLAKEILPLTRLRLRGLMAIPAPAAAPMQQRQAFRQLYELQQTLLKQGFELDTLSMGMSSDLEAAILEGATIVRVGTDIFGARMK